jgi:hypothetical protein
MVRLGVRSFHAWRRFLNVPAGGGEVENADSPPTGQVRVAHRHLQRRVTEGPFVGVLRAIRVDRAQKESIGQAR